ncbi:MAG: diguanylate cyclase, partial [Candidatus Eisenbacteria bacterium]|nr:diguanylate cyclase [Candidatus Eisenbacteria bacterium]
MGFDNIDPTQLLESLNDGVYYVDRGRHILYWNEAAERITGYSRTEVIGHPCYSNILQHVSDDGSALCQGDCPLARTLRDGRRRQDRIYLRHKNGHRVAVLTRVAPVFGAGGEIVGAVESFSDDTWREDLRERLAELEKLARLDPLTGLLNRRSLDQELESRLDEFRRYGWPFGVLLIDLDGFKEVNDTYGHETGDRVLQMVARSLVAGARVFDSVGRWGGEEFLMAVTNVEGERLLNIGTRVCRMVEASELREPHLIRVTCSVGAAGVAPNDTLSTVSYTHLTL